MYPDFLVFQVEEAGRLLLSTIRIEQLTSDLSWRPGIPHKVEESNWITTVVYKAKSIAIIGALLRPRSVDGKQRKKLKSKKKIYK
jgi:hypothetical protein